MKTKFDEGYEAFESGLRPWQCPYEEGSDWWDDWMDGHDCAEMDAKNSSKGIKNEEG